LGLFWVGLGCGGTVQLIETSDDAPFQETLPFEDDIPTTKRGTEISKEKRAVVDFTDAKKVGELMNFLTSDDLQGRDSGSEGIEKAAIYIENQLKSARIRPYYETYRDTLSNYEPISFNVLGVLQGHDPELKDEFIIIGAHYDHIGKIAPIDGDSIANGANDNASGSVTVLELARYFGKKKSNKRSLIFAWFSAEEKGLLGSKHLAKRMKAENLNLYAMLNFEMVGVPLVSKKYFMYTTGYHRSNLAEVGNAYAGGNHIGFLPTAKQYSLFYRSDNYPFFKEFNVPAHTFCTFDFTNFGFYHKPGDEVSELDMKFMAEVVNTVIPVVEGVANGPKGELKLVSTEGK